jgi:hypothetical protein
MLVFKLRQSGFSPSKPKPARARVRRRYTSPTFLRFAMRQKWISSRAGALLSLPSISLMVPSCAWIDRLMMAMKQSHHVQHDDM